MVGVGGSVRRGRYIRIYTEDSSSARRLRLLQGVCGYLVTDGIGQRYALMISQGLMFIGVHK